MKEDIRTYRFDKSFTERAQFIENINQVYISTTEDKLVNYIRDYRDSITARSAWQTPLASLVSLGVTYVTATFSDKHGQPASFWEALFICLLIGSFIWTLIGGIRAIAARLAGESPDEALFKKIKNETTNLPGSA